MIGKRFILGAAAADELAEAGSWLNADRLGLGDELLDEALGAFARIREAPFSGAALAERSTRASSVRRLVLPRFPYVVIYVVHPDEVRIIAFAHTSRAPTYWHDR